MFCDPGPVGNPEPVRCQSHKQPRSAGSAAGALRFESGDLTHKLNPSGWAELSLLIDAMNAMAARLHDRIAAVIHQRNELEAVLGGMVEAVLVRRQ